MSEGRWFRFYDGALDDPKVQKLEPALFKVAFMAALRGDASPFSVHVKPYNSRPNPIGWGKIRSRIFARDDYTCRYCGERGRRLECDHVIPLARGGTNDDANLTTACFRCNRKKAAKRPEDWFSAIAQIRPLSGPGNEG